MNIGEKIKQLRKQKNITQEQLAEYLNISTQAVSKWETNLSLPDITLIPAIANIFSTSADILLGIDIAGKENKIDEIVKVAMEYAHNGYQKKAAQVLREGLKEFPDSYKLMSALLGELYGPRGDWGEISEEEREALRNECVALGEKILAECTVDEYRHRAIQLLCYTYARVENGAKVDECELEKAVELANRMPDTCCSKQNLLGLIYKGSKRFEIGRNNLLLAIDDVVLKIVYNAAPLDDGKCPYTTSELITIKQKAVELIKLIFDDGNYGFLGHALTRIYIGLAICYMRTNDCDNAIKNLILAAGQSISLDTDYTSEKEYTCLLFRGQKFGGVWHSGTENMSLELLNEMKEPVFDSIREKLEFRNLENKLQKYAKNRKC